MHGRSKIKVKSTAISAFLALMTAIALVGCSFLPEKIYTSTIFSMDTIMELQIAGREDYTPEAEEYIRCLEKALSVTDPESEIAKLNAAGEGELSSETGLILKRALEVCERTDGALDISIYPVLKTWGFTTGEYRVPSDAELEELLKNVDYSKVSIWDDEWDTGDDSESQKESGSEEGQQNSETEKLDEENCPQCLRVELEDGMQIDLGSVVKGYTGTAVADMLREKGVTHALINLGGNVQCIGAKPNGAKWQVAIKSPFEDSVSGIIGVMAADDVAIITSGGYERYFEENGKTYWHILDPKTGKPADKGLASVTIIGKDGLLCDGLSTALFVKGLDEAIEHYKESDDFEAIFITQEKEIYITQDISEDFSLTGEYHDMPITIITK